MSGLILRTVAVAAFAALALLPVAWMVSMAFKPPAEWTSASGSVSFLPKNPTWSNFAYVFTGEAMNQPVSLDRTVWWPMFASLLTSVMGTLIAVVCGTAAAYAAAGVDRLSVGATTHSAPALDLSLALEVAP